GNREIIGPAEPQSVQSLFIRKGIKMRRPYLIFVLLVIIVTVFQGASAAQIGKRPAGRIVVCMIQLEHADAEQLAAVLRPFLSPDGSLSPYTPTNTLIIRDRQPVVNMLSEAIKGRPCTPSAQSPGD
ncbi:MAG: secretin N-terminal domain-containing protein, partial [Desulfobacterales bacterium]